MKKLSMVLLLALVASISFGQEFLGVEVSGKKNVVLGTFKSKGFKVVGDTTKDIVILEGEAAGQKVELAIVCTPTSKTVWKFSVYLPEQSSWIYLKKNYEDYLGVLTKKYGEPEKKYSFFSSPYDEGDGYEMTGVHSGKCHYVAFWPESVGLSVEINKWKQVQISYQNIAGASLNKIEKDLISSKAF